MLDRQLIIELVQLESSDFSVWTVGFSAVRRVFDISVFLFWIRFTFVEIHFGPRSRAFVLVNITKLISI